MIGRLRRRARRSERGAAAVEFALVVPFLILLLLGIISYGVMLSFRQSVSQAATEGARAAAVSFNRADKQASGRSAVDDALQSFGVTCAGSALRRDGATVGTCNVTAPGPCVPAATGVECVRVTISYDYKNHPLVPSFPGVGLALPDTLTYSAQARVS